MNLPVEVTLKRPLLVGDVTYDVLSFDEPDIGGQIAYAELEASLPEPQMIKQADGSEVSSHSPLTSAKVNLFWIATLADIPEGVARKIKDSDLAVVNAAVEAVFDFVAAQGEGVGDAPGKAAPAK